MYRTTTAVNGNSAQNSQFCNINISQVNAHRPFACKYYSRNNNNIEQLLTKNRTTFCRHRRRRRRHCGIDIHTNLLIYTRIYTQTNGIVIQNTEFIRQMVCS